MTRTVTVDVRYPPTEQPLELHLEDDWPTPRLPDRTSDDGTCRSFDLTLDRPTLAFKPVLARGGERLWARGQNCRIPAGAERVEVFPHFAPDAAPAPDPEPLPVAPRGLRIQTFLPPGYAENPLARLPLVLLHGGPQALLPEGPPGEGRLPEVLAVLELLNAVRPAIHVAVHPEDPELWTRPGYAAYADHLIQELLPCLEERYRIQPGPEGAVALGVGQGGVAAFYLAWEWPGVFGGAGCLSGTFGARDNLLERVGTESRRDLRLYLDCTRPSGLELTWTLLETLRLRGYSEDRACGFSFPEPPSAAAVPLPIRAQQALQYLFRPSL